LIGVNKRVIIISEREGRFSIVSSSPLFCHFFICDFRPPLFRSLSCALRFLFVSLSLVVRSGVIKTLCKTGGSFGSRSLVQLRKTLALLQVCAKSNLEHHKRGRPNDSPDPKQQLLSKDVEICGHCRKKCSPSSEVLQCNLYSTWVHATCDGLTTKSNMDRLIN